MSQILETKIIQCKCGTHNQTPIVKPDGTIEELERCRKGNCRRYSDDRKTLEGVRKRSQNLLLGRGYGGRKKKQIIVSLEKPKPKKYFVCLKCERCYENEAQLNAHKERLGH